MTMSHDTVRTQLPTEFIRQGPGREHKNQTRKLGRGELGDGLGALGDGVLGELAGEDEADGGLNLPGRDGGLLVVPRELGGLAGELLEDVVDEGVHDGHGLGGDADVRVHLLEHLEDVDLVGLHALLGLLLPLLVAALLGRRHLLLRLGLLARGGLLHRLLLGCLGGHGAAADASRSREV
ncbi:hypothetical protein VPH35_115559 [Triticum aestivum]|uniref:Uncharacterized protein n=1 Tax=Aegilops tauschii subsp. strangulata TaxID=200361 RepID=A0A453N480_AEGTS